jgi:hypothetical protein
MEVCRSSSGRYRSFYCTCSTNKIFCVSWNPKVHKYVHESSFELSPEPDFSFHLFLGLPQFLLIGFSGTDFLCISYRVHEYALAISSLIWSQYIFGSELKFWRSPFGSFLHSCHLLPLRVKYSPYHPVTEQPDSSSNACDVFRRCSVWIWPGRQLSYKTTVCSCLRFCTYLPHHMVS